MKYNGGNKQFWYKKHSLFIVLVEVPYGTQFIFQEIHKIIVLLACFWYIVHKDLFYVIAEDENETRGTDAD